jgi:hypothetical protein
MVLVLGKVKYQQKFRLTVSENECLLALYCELLK